MGLVKLGLLWTMNLFQFLKHQYFFFLENLDSVHLQSNSTLITDLPLSQGSWPWPYQLLESSTNQNLVLPNRVVLCIEGYLLCPYLYLLAASNAIPV